MYYETYYCLWKKVAAEMSIRRFQLKKREIQFALYLFWFWISIWNSILHACKVYCILYIMKLCLFHIEVDATHLGPSKKVGCYVSRKTFFIRYRLRYDFIQVWNLGPAVCLGLTTLNSTSFLQEAINKGLSGAFSLIINVTKLLHGPADSITRLLTITTAWPSRLLPVFNFSSFVIV